MNPKKAPVQCLASALFEIIEQDLDLGICCDISFSITGKKHRIGAWGDNGNTYKNVQFYFDKQTFSSLEELKSKAIVEGNALISYPELITVHECDACYPREDKILEKYYQLYHF